MLDTDWSAIASIYLQGIETGNATFQQDVPTCEIWNTGHLAESRIVACCEGQVIRWAALSAVSGRCVYAGGGRSECVCRQ